MSSVTIREIRGEEIADAIYRLTPYAFQATPPLPNKDELVERIVKHEGIVFYAALTDGQADALAGSHAMTQNVRGQMYPITGVFLVATHPSARRKGLARRLLDSLHAEMHAAGRAFACLYPFRESFYERMGYVPFPQPRFIKFATTTLEPLLKQALAGEVELSLLSEKQDEYRSFLHKLQAGRHGLILFNSPMNPVPKRSERWLALAKSGGETIGAALYDIYGDTIANFTLRASNFYYSEPLGRYLLLEWLARHLNQATQIELWLAPDEFPETWYPDLDYTFGSLGKVPMGRALDVARIGGMQTGPGRFTARISDPICPWNEGVWTFETVDGALTVQPGGEEHCDLSIQALSALVYGVNDPAEFAFHGWGEAPVGVQATMRSMFPRLLPYIHEKF